MNFVISKNSFAVITATTLAIFAFCVFMYGAFYDIDNVLVGGVGLLVGTFFIFTDFVSMSEKHNSFVGNSILVLFLTLWLASSWFLAYWLTQNNVRCTVFTVVFAVALRRLARVIKKKGLKIM